VHADTLHCPRGRAFSPERVDQAVDRDGLIRVQEEHGQHGSLLASPERERLSLSEYLE
jgi:hypothetical protein